MKIVFVLGILILYASCQWQGKNAAQGENSSQDADTLSIVKLNNNVYRKFRFKVLHLNYPKSQREEIHLLQNDSLIAALVLPLADIEVKNFVVNTIEETDEGFKIGVDWGGGSYFYERTFNFSYFGNKFYLDNIRMRTYKQQPEEETSWNTKITPPTPVNQVQLNQYINNN